MNNNFLYFKEDVHVGDNVSICLWSGGNVTGKVLKIDNSVLLENKSGEKFRVQGFQMKNWHIDNLHVYGEKPRDVYSYLIEEWRKFFELASFGDLNINIVTNAVITEITCEFVYVKTDDGTSYSCVKRYMAGFDNKTTKVGDRVYCRNKGKRACYVSLVSQSLWDLEELFIKSMYSEMIRIPYVNSIIYYFRNVQKVNSEAKRQLSKVNGIFSLLVRLNPKKAEYV